jgi:hypothetical protein
MLATGTNQYSVHTQVIQMISTETPPMAIVSDNSRYAVGGARTAPAFAGRSGDGGLGHWPIQPATSLAA